MVSVVAAVYSLRLRQIDKKRKLAEQAARVLEEKVNLRTAELREKKEEIEQLKKLGIDTSVS